MHLPCDVLRLPGHARLAYLTWRPRSAAGAAASSSAELAASRDSSSDRDGAASGVLLSTAPPVHPVHASERSASSQQWGNTAVQESLKPLEDEVKEGNSLAMATPGALTMKRFSDCWRGPAGQAPKLPLLPPPGAQPLAANADRLGGLALALCLCGGRPQCLPIMQARNKRRQAEPQISGLTTHHAGRTHAAPARAPACGLGSSAHLAAGGAIDATPGLIKRENKAPLAGVACTSSSSVSSPSASPSSASPPPPACTLRMLSTLHSQLVVDSAARSGQTSRSRHEKPLDSMGSAAQGLAHS
jgi:hypothetical protein